MLMKDFKGLGVLSGPPAGDHSETLKRTKERYDRRNSKKRVYCAWDVGRKVTADLFLQPLALFLSGEAEYDGKPLLPNPPPADLGDVVARLDPETLALIALTPILDGIHRGWDGDDGKSGKMLLRMKIGKYLRDRLDVEKILRSPTKDDQARAANIHMLRWKKAKHWRKLYRYITTEWESDQYVIAGSWLYDCAMTLDYFTQHRGLPAIAPKWQGKVDSIAEELLLREPYMLPHTETPPPWTGWRTQYHKRIGLDFVRDWKPETEAAITKAFKGPFPHAAGVTTLQNVPLVVDQTMVDLAAEFAATIMDRSGDKHEADKLRIKYDVRDARWCGNQRVMLPYSCDKRGRLYAGCNLHYGREDHVRAMFRFAEGKALAYDDIKWLEIHAANCEGTKDKAPWPERHAWVLKNRKKITKIAADPRGTFELVDGEKGWRYADKPFAFVAACRELAAAWREPTGFATRLPIPLDGTCNGIQHLAMLGRDRDAAYLVNLVDSRGPELQYEYSKTRDGQILHSGAVVTHGDAPRDLYGVIIDHVKTELSTATGAAAEFWREQFARMTHKDIRKLVKTPAMAFAYSISRPGIVKKLAAVYFDKKTNWPKPPEGGWGYLADKILAACDQTLPGPARLMRYIQGLAEHCAARGRFLEWTSPTGFPVSNNYREADKRPVYLIEGGCSIEFEVANGTTGEIDHKKLMSAASPNFIHSLDAAHLIRSVNAAIIEGIRNILTVHDCYAVAAPDVSRFRDILKREFCLLYAVHRPLERLHARNSFDGFPPRPPYGDLDPLDVQGAEYPWI